MNFAKFVLTYLPNNGCSVERSRYEKLGIIRPTEIHDIANMAPELPRMAPLYHFFDFAKLNWHGLELPNNDHLIIGAAGKELSVG